MTAPRRRCLRVRRPRPGVPGPPSRRSWPHHQPQPGRGPDYDWRWTLLTLLLYGAAVGGPEPRDPDEIGLGRTPGGRVEHREVTITYGEWEAQT